MHWGKMKVKGGNRGKKGKGSWGKNKGVKTVLAVGGNWGVAGGGDEGKSQEGKQEELGGVRGDGSAALGEEQPPQQHQPVSPLVGPNAVVTPRFRRQPLPVTLVIPFY